MALIDRTRFGVLAAATTGNALSLTPAVHATFGVFLLSLSEQFGWPRASISAVLGILAVTCALLYPLAGRHADRHGARGLVLVGMAGLAACIALLALSTGSLPQFYLTFLGIGVFGALPSSALFSKVVADWFDRNRGAMLGISAGGGNGLGATLMPVVAAALLPAIGWRGTYLAVAGIVLLVGLPVLWWGLRDAPAAQAEADRPADQAGMPLAQAARTPAFWLILVAIAMGAGCLTAVFSHVVPILVDRGFGIGAGTAVIGIFALTCAGWQIATGALLDGAASPRIVAPMFLCATAGLLLLEHGQAGLPLAGAGVLLGIGLGSQYGALPVFVARYFGRASFGTIIGIMYSAVILAQGVTPILLDHAFDVQGSYRTAVAVTAAVLALSAGLILLLPTFRRSRAEAVLAVA